MLVWLSLGLFPGLGETALPVSRKATAWRAPTGRVLREQYRTALRRLHESRAVLYRLGARHIAVLDGGRLLLVTSEYAHGKGYLGPSVFAIRTDRRLRVERIVFIASPDTPTYVKLVGMRLNRLTGQRLDARRRPRLEITGATKTCLCATFTVNNTLDQAAALLRRYRFLDGRFFSGGTPLDPEAVLMPKNQ